MKNEEEHAAMLNGKHHSIVSSLCTDTCCTCQISIGEGVISIKPTSGAEKATAYKTQGTRVQGIWHR